MLNYIVSPNYLDSFDFFLSENCGVIVRSNTPFILI